MRKNTHSISFIFLLLLALPQVLIIALQLWQWHVQHEAHERLERESLQTIAVKAEAFTWENEKEVSIDGKMFDIKSFKIEKGTYVFTGLFDEKETALKNFLKKQQWHSNNFYIVLLLLAQHFITAFSFLYFLYRPFFKKLVAYFRVYCPFYYMDILIPPPKPFAGISRSHLYWIKTNETSVIKFSTGHH